MVNSATVVGALGTRSIVHLGVRPVKPAAKELVKEKRHDSLSDPTANLMMPPGKVDDRMLPIRESDWASGKSAAWPRGDGSHGTDFSRKQGCVESRKKPAFDKRVVLYSVSPKVAEHLRCSRPDAGSSWAVEVSQNSVHHPAELRSAQVLRIDFKPPLKTQATACMQKIQNISLPRSGHHLLVRCLTQIYKDQLNYCEFYTHCRKTPCRDPATNLQKKPRFQIANSPIC